MRANIGHTACAMLPRAHDCGCARENSIGIFVIREKTLEMQQQQQQEGRKPFSCNSFA
jgi:hypothetical protein